MLDKVDDRCPGGCLYRIVARLPDEVTARYYFETEADALAFVQAEGAQVVSIWLLYHAANKLGLARWIWKEMDYKSPEESGRFVVKGVDSRRW